MSYLRRSLNYINEHPYLYVIFLGILVRLPLLFTHLSYDTDAWRQTDTASIAHHFFVNGFNIFYPQIFWGGDGPGYVETEFQLYPFIVSILYLLFGGEQYWLGKLTSLLFSVFSWIFFVQLAREVLKNKRAEIWALCSLVFSPLYLRYSVAFMPEATVLMFYMAALFFFLKWVISFRAGFLFAASLCTAMAFLVKPTSIHIGLVFALLAFGERGWQVLRRWQVWASFVVAILPGALWYLHARNIYLEYGNTFGLLSGGDSKFGDLQHWLAPHLYYHLAYLDLKWILGYGVVFLFVAGLIVATRKKDFRLVIYGVIVVGLYYLLVPRYSHEEWGIQYHVYMLPFAALGVGLGVDWVFSKYVGYLARGILWLSSGVFLGTAIVVFGEMLLFPAGNLYVCAGFVQELVPKSERVVVSTTSPAFDNGVPNNYQEPQIFFYSQRYGWSFPADWHDNIEKIEEYRLAGASYFVIYSKELFENHPSLMQYLKTNSVQIGPGIEEQCAIYRFLPLSEQVDIQ